MNSISTKRITFIVITLLALYVLLGMGIDLITTSLPQISQNLNVSNHFSKNLITLYLLGAIGGNITIGFLTDALGRRLLTFGALSVFVLASLLPISIPHPRSLMVCRFLQGGSLAFYSVLARAILSDILPNDRLMRVTALTATMWGIGTIIGPVIGSYLQYYSKWQACFYFYAFFAFIGLLNLVVVLPETHLKRQMLNMKQIKQNYAQLIAHRTFIGMAMMMGVSYSFIIVFNTMSPFLIQTELDYSSLVFGRVSLCCSLFFLLSTFAYQQLVKKYDPQYLIKIFVFVSLLVALFAFTIVCFYKISLNIIVIPSLAMFSICGILYPAAMTSAITLFRHISGSAASVMSILNMLITCLTAYTVSFMNSSTGVPLHSMYVLLTTLGCMIYWLLLEKKKIPIDS